MRATVFVLGLALFACEPRQIDLRTDGAEDTADTGSEGDSDDEEEAADE